MNPRVLLRSIALLVLTFIGIMIYWFFFAPKPGGIPEGQVIDLNENENPYSALFIPTFNLVDREGEAFDQSYLDGKYTVVEFFYTSCPLI